MNTPDPLRELKNLVLLAGSGEISAEEQEQLDHALEENPELAAWAEETGVLIQADRELSPLLVPPQPELKRARLLAVPRPAPLLPRVLTLAALLVLALGLLTHLRRPEPAPLPELARVAPLQADLLADDPLLEELALLDEDLSVWARLSIEEPAALDTENDWAELLLDLENPI